MSDFTSLSRAQWLELADRFYGLLDERLAAFTPREWRRVTPYLGWRACDVLAHMTSAMPVNFRQMLDRALAGQSGPPSEFDTFTRNAREVARRTRTPVPDLMREFRAELEPMLASYRTMSDAAWLRPAWFFVGPVNVRTLFLAQLADNVFHERDLLLVAGRWKGIDPECGRPLADWFLREFRPASFRPERADGLEAVVQYRLSGPAGGEWTMIIRDRACRVEPGDAAAADLTIEADLEDLVAAGLARAVPWVGSAARMVDWIRGPARAEDVVAAITGSAGLLAGLVRRRIRVTGERSLARRVSGAFWHFWQRTRQTEENIRRGRAA